MGISNPQYGGATDATRATIADASATGTINDNDTATATLLQAAPIFVDDTSGLSISALRARCRRLKQRSKVELVVVDYLQLMRGANLNKNTNREQEVAEISRGLKSIARDMEMPVIVLSQLNRSAEKRENDDKRPQLSDLRESGSIEQDADVVLFVYREEYYLKNKEPREGTEEHINWMAEMERAHGRAEAIIGKQRHGPTGTVPLAFEAEVTRFSNLADEDKLPARM